jgi:arylsulfatase A
LQARSLIALLCFALILICRPTSAVAATLSGKGAGRPPNIVIIYADDLGYGDLESYGHPTIRTPVLTKLASQGQQWTQFYAAAPVCTPSRGSLLTGRLPARIGLEAPAGMPNVFFSFSKGGLPHSEITLPLLLKQRGYKTGLIGKWHLGPTAEHAPVHHGFDYFFGLAGSNDHDPAVAFSMDLFFEEPTEGHWAVPLYRNDRRIEDATSQAQLNDRLTSEAIGLIREPSKKPLFLLLAYTLPHLPLFPAKDFRGASKAGLYGDAVEELDHRIGQVMAALAARADGRRTLVVFTSDNGPIELMRERAGSAGPLRGGKGTTWEGGMRVPAIFWGPGIVRPGPVRDLGSQLDLFATIAELAGIALPQDRPYDGVSLLPTIRTRAPTRRDSLFYYRAARIFAIRDRRYKAHFVTQGGYDDERGPIEHAPPLIFDLWQDPGERHPIANPDPALVRNFEDMRDHQVASVPIAPSELVEGIPARDSEAGEGNANQKEKK